MLLALAATALAAVASQSTGGCVDGVRFPTNRTWDSCAFETETDAQLSVRIDAISATLNSTNDALGARITETQAAVDFAYFFFCGCLVFLMQLGFAMLEVGCVQEKNINNIILKGVLDICIAAIAFWTVGFAIAFGGGKAGSFIGGERYWFGDCLDQRPGCWDGDGAQSYHQWFFQFAFAATASTIVSGAVAERCTTICYALYALILTAFVYPVVVHWQWGSGYTVNRGAVDYAGSAVVHMTGGLAAIVGAAIIGPRHGRFTGPIFNVVVHDVPVFSVVFQTLGTLILWFGWYGFNTGSTLGITWTTQPDATPNEAGLVIMNTTLGPAAGGLTAMLLAAFGHLWAGEGFILKLQPVLNGILAGLVSITAGCGDIRPGTAFAMGVVGGCIYTATSWLQKQLKIDDVVDAGPVHFWCGIWGTLGLGLLADNAGTGLSTPGVFSKGKGTVFGENLILVCLVICWVGPLMSLTFGGLKLAGLARVSAEVEGMGLDISKHGVGSKPNDANPKPPEVIASAAVVQAPNSEVRPPAPLPEP